MENKFTNEDLKLFHKIETDIKKNCAKYSEAGKWLDQFYDVAKFWQEKVGLLQTLNEICKSHKECECEFCKEAEWLSWVIEKKNFTSQDEYIEILDDTDQKFIEGLFKEEVPAIYRLLEAKSELTSKYISNCGMLSEQDAKCIYLTNWLFTSPESRNDTDMEITKFQRYELKELEGIIYSRMGLLFSTQRNIEEWIKMIKTAQHRLDFEKQNKAKPASPKKSEEKAEGSLLTMPVRSSKENWEAIESEFDISKNNFGRKINFVSDEFKRKIIFRDVEHAFVLASQDFSKSALILAGGVIEELLRLYLKHKKIKPKDNRFIDYIEACEDNDLLKRGVSRLTDSVRDFRNLVHLDKEKTKINTISKPKAKGAVAAIFTIANDFQKVLSK